MPDMASTSNFAKGESSNEALPTAYERLEDEQLLGAIIRGDRDAFDAFYDRYARAVYSVAMRMLRDSGASEEVTQDVFLKVWSRAHSYRADKGYISNWLFAITRHRTIDELRRRIRTRSKDVYGIDLTNKSSGGSNEPLDYANLQFERSLLREALFSLEFKQRELLLMSYFGGLTHTEISKQLGYPLGTVKTRIRIGLKKLRRVLNQDQELGLQKLRYSRNNQLFWIR